MKLAHIVKLRVFCNEDENERKIEDKLSSLVPFDIEKEKIILVKRTVVGFDDKKISVFEIVLKKDRHINAFLKLLNEKLSEDQKELLVNQASSRLDNELNFFMRFDKEKLLKDEYKIIDSGNCFHITINIAAFPSKKSIALKHVKEMLRTSGQ
jgi:RNA binding exosome subunit